MTDTFAIRGGKKVVTISYPHVQRPPESLEDEIDALKMVRNTSTQPGYSQTKIREFQSLFLDSIDNQAKHAMTCSSMHESFYAICKVLDIGSGDTMVCTGTSGEWIEQVARLLGFELLYCRTEKENLCMDIQSLKTILDDTVKAVIVTHQRGVPTSIEKVRATVGEGVTLIEDCTFAFGVMDNGLPAGTRGDVGLFPMHYENLVFTGHGAVLVTSNTLLYDCLCSWKKHDVRSVEYLGGYHQYTLTPFHSTIGKYSLRHRNRIIHGSMRCSIYLRERLEGVQYLSMLPLPDLQTNDHISWWYRFKCWYDPEQLRKLHVDGVITLLQSEGVDIKKINCHGAVQGKKCLVELPHFYDWYTHKEIIDQYIAAFRKVQLNLFC